MEGFEPAEIRLGPQIFLATFGGIRIVRVGTRNCFGNLLVHENILIDRLRVSGRFCKIQSY